MVFAQLLSPAASFPGIGTSGYWWVVLFFAVVVALVRIYWRLKTGSWRKRPPRRSDRE
jgi:O-antigen/teichoic acid export membrane protein